MLGASILISYFVPVFVLPLQCIHVAGLFVFRKSLPISVLSINIILFILIYGLEEIEKHRVINLVSTARAGLLLLILLLVCFVWIYWSAWQTAVQRADKGGGAGTRGADDGNAHLHL